MSSQVPTKNLPVGWIDWNAKKPVINDDGTTSNLTYYRKMTNLWGGLPGSGELNWLSFFTTEASQAKGQYSSIAGPQYEQVPKNLWFLDQRTGALKISDANDKLTYSVNPLADTGRCSDCKNQDNISSDCKSCNFKKSGASGCDNFVFCPNSSANTENCVYRWNRQQDASGSKKKCGGTEWSDAWHQGVVGLISNLTKKDNQWAGPYSSSCDKWSYITNGMITEPSSQDISGTFCNNTMNQEIHMRSYLGCDCDHGGEFNKNKCVNLQGHECNSTKSDDPKIAYSPKYEAQRAVWQFIDDAGAFACCSQGSVDTLPQCKFAFNPTKSVNKCPIVAQQYCAENWGVDNDIGAYCQGFLVNSKANWGATQGTIQSYITSRSDAKSENGNPQPEDYISYKLWKSGNELSKKYYTEDNTCLPDYESNDCDPNRYDPVTKPCCRDDSRDPFFVNTMPYLCNFSYDTDHPQPYNSTEGVCDGQLQYFCQSFTRDDVANDLTLQNICGCNLLTNPKSSPSNPIVNYSVNSKTMNLSRCSDNENKPYPICEKPSESPYYQGVENTAGDNCDIICATSLIQSGTLGGKCVTPVCTIDNVTINQLNTNAKNTTITQSCDGGSCYIVDLSINEIDSQLGDTNILQNCATCYFVPNGDDLLTVEPYDCLTGEPLGSPKKESGDGSSVWSFFTKNISLLIILLVIIGVVICFFIASYYNRKYKKQIENIIPPEGIAFGNEYWESF